MFFLLVYDGELQSRNSDRVAVHFFSSSFFLIHSKNEFCLAMSVGKFSVFLVPLSKGSGLFNKRSYSNSQKSALSKSNQDIC